jgi:nucleoside-diphosphate-sugar epimerase
MTALIDAQGRPSRLAIYGASGFIGCHLLADLLRQGHQIRALARSKTKAEWLRRLGADVLLGDIRDPQIVRSVAAGCDLVFHLVTGRFDQAARLLAYRETNVLGTANVISAAVDAGVRSLVFTSSMSVYGRLSPELVTEETPATPTLFHDRSKLEAERLVLRRGCELGISVVVARLPWVFGPGQPRFRKIFHQVVEKRSFTIYGSCDPWRNIAHVGDIVDGLKRCAATSAKQSGCYLLPGHNVTLSEILRLIADEAGVRLRVKRKPLWPAEVISRSCRLLLTPFGRELDFIHGVEFFVRNHKVDGSKARCELGYVPRTSLRETIHGMVTWYRKSNYAGSNEQLLSQWSDFPK